MQDFTVRVKAGASYLDLAKPDWAESIDLASLDLGSGDRCVIGQSFGRYYKGLEDLNLDEETSQALGFNTPYSADYEALTEAWVTQIRKRQTKPHSHTVRVNETVAYVIERPTDASGYTSPNPTISRVSMGEVTDRVSVGTSQRSIWRGIGEALIALSEESA